MNAFLTQLLRMSLTAGWMILFLLILRPVMKKLPRRFSCVAWALVAIRLALPISFESKVSLVPQAVSNPEFVVNQLPAAVNRTETAAALTPIGQSATGVNWLQVLPLIWTVGAAVLAAYALVGYIRLLKRVQVSMKVGENLYLCDGIRSPFVLGLFRAKIYLPSDLDSHTSPYVLAHERMHLRRKDPVWKLQGYGLLCAHWFNPLCWVAYILFCRDLEQACDEAVVRNWSHQQRKEYSTALLECSMPRHIIAACPVAFGEVGVKQRIRAVLNYRKPKFWAVALSVVLCITLAVCLLTNPVRAEMEKAQAVAQTAQEPIPIILGENTVLRNSPSESSQEKLTLPAGSAATIVRRENISGADWAFIQDADSESTGWIPFSGEEVALGFFRSYVAASALDTPDTAESYLYFRTEYAREVYRQMYAPVTGWDATGAEQVLSGLWCIRWENEDGTDMDYAFVMEQDGQLYVAQSVHALPDEIMLRLDVSAYEKENAMYMNDDLLENQAVTARLLQFAEPSRVTVEIIDDSWQKPESQWQLDFTDAVCSTDTWRVSDIPTKGGAKCIVTLYAGSGACARVWDVDSTVLVTYPDGSMECYRADLGSEELLALIYDWATEAEK